MSFVSLSFLFLFLPLVLLVYYWIPLRIKNYVLAFFSLVFLAWAGPAYALLLILTVLLNGLLGLAVSHYRKTRQGKWLFLLSLICNLVLLTAFKYSGFLALNLNYILVPAGLEPLKIPDWLLPLGISFYTFRLLSYQIELYRGNIPPAGNFVYLFLYTSFFPQLGAGPIVRYSAFYQQLYKRSHNTGAIKRGLQRFLLGLLKKVLIANNLGLMADAVFSLPGSDLTFSSSWLGIMAYSLQVYYDFSGYTDMAVGLSGMLGFSAPENFNFPYLARSVKDFWRRWHMSLTGWFRDFLFLPLAYFFSRKLPESRYFNIKTDRIIYSISIFITWLLVGFWHGASWTFIAWGVTFGLFLILEQMGLGRILRKAGLFVRHLYTLCIVILAWVFFRAGSFSFGFDMIRAMTGFSGVSADIFEYYRFLTPSFILVTLIAITGAAGWLNNFRDFCWKAMVLRHYKTTASIVTERKKLLFFTMSTVLLLSGFMLAVADILRGGFSPFIYFKF